jgi:hypothetical protein
MTRDDVSRIVSGLSDETIARIIATGADANQLLEAFTWLREDEYLGPELERRPSGLVGQVYDILVEDETELEEERD